MMIIIVPDAEVPDAEVCPGAEPCPDAEIPDAEIPDAEIPDAEIPDVEVPDAELPDAQGEPACQDMLSEGARAQLGQICVVGQGQCAMTGIFICEDGQLQCDAVPGAPDVERCNLADDDCDGEVDESFEEQGVSCFVGIGVCAEEGEYLCEDGSVFCSSTPSEPDPDETDNNCNGVDEDCDGRADEAYVAVVSYCGVGVCSAVGTLECEGGVEVEICTPGAPESLFDPCDGLDNDCDGASDEGGAPCEAGQGPCRVSGVTECDDDNQEICGATPPEGSPEICNGVDDDCDGQIDNDLPNEGEACASDPACGGRPGVLVCLGQAGSVCQAPRSGERCNGEDDDCDSRVDEADPELMCPPRVQSSNLCGGAQGCLYTCDVGYFPAPQGIAVEGCTRGCGLDPLGAGVTVGPALPGAPSEMAVAAFGSNIAVAWIIDGDLYYWFADPSNENSPQLNAYTRVGAEINRHFAGVKLAAAGGKMVLAAMYKTEPGLGDVIDVNGRADQIYVRTLRAENITSGTIFQQPVEGELEHIALTATASPDSEAVDRVALFAVVNNTRLETPVVDVLRYAITPSTSMSEGASMGINGVDISAGAPGPVARWVNDRVALITQHSGGGNTQLRLFIRDYEGAVIASAGPGPVSAANVQGNTVPSSALSLWHDEQAASPLWLTYRGAQTGESVSYLLTPNGASSWLFTAPVVNEGVVIADVDHLGTTLGGLHSFVTLQPADFAQLWTLRWLDNSSDSQGEVVLKSAESNEPFMARITPNAAVGGGVTDTLRAAWLEIEPESNELYLKVGVIDCP